MNGSRFAVSLPAGQIKSENHKGMKTALTLILAVLMVGFVGCASLGSRIQHHQAAFDSWPADVQAAVRSGKIDVGFTAEQVRVALGDPYRIFTRKSAEGEEEIWAYREGKPHFSIGVGVASGGYNGGAAGGVAYDRRDDSLDDATRVIFKAGLVVAVEQQRKG